MKVKRFEAPNIKNALALAKKELGDDAIILATKNLAPEGGNPARVEVVAAVDFDIETVIAPYDPRLNAEPAISRRSAVDHRGAARSHINDNTGVNAGANERPQNPPHLPLDEQQTTRVSLSREAHHLQRRVANSVDERQRAVPLSIPPTLSKTPTTTKIRNSGYPNRAKNERPNPEEVARWRNQILEQLLVRPLNLNEHPGPTIIALVGPTGVGKTTTAAKIAAWFSLRENARVAMLSMDCYRIGATEQLRTYARIMCLPCEVALREPDLNAALNKHRHKDLIIIDTAGKSPFDDKHIPELRRWFSPHRIIPHLVLNATAKKEDINHIIATYRRLGVSAAILTKLDETRTYASLCQQVTRAGLSIASLSTGQKVPEDFLPASKELLKTLFGYGWDAAMNRQSAAAA